MKKRIAHFGTFDVDNYGDLLFPHIARYRFPELDWIHISPTDNETSFIDSKKVISYNNAFKQEFDAVVIGGGNIIYARHSLLNNYKHKSFEAYPSLWIGAAGLAKKQGINFVFNAPGILQKDFNLIERIIAKIVFSDAAYLSFREGKSCEIASNFTSNQINVVPDTGFDIARMWSLDRVQDNYIAVNLNQRYHSPPEHTAKYLDLISKQFKLPIKLVIIGACHGDLQFSIKVNNLMKCKSELISSSSLREIANTIGNAKFFLGSSMHAFITALTYKVPSLLILNEGLMIKFKGLMEITGLSDKVICNDWDQAMKRIENPAIISEEYESRIEERLNKHWDDMMNKVFSNVNNNKSILVDNWELMFKYHRKVKNFSLKAFIRKYLK